MEYTKLFNKALNLLNDDEKVKLESISKGLTSAQQDEFIKSLSPEYTKYSEKSEYDKKLKNSLSKTVNNLYEKNATILEEYKGTKVFQSAYYNKVADKFLSRDQKEKAASLVENLSKPQQNSFAKNIAVLAKEDKNKLNEYIESMVNSDPKEIKALFDNNKEIFKRFREKGVDPRASVIKRKINQKASSSLNYKTPMQLEEAAYEAAYDLRPKGFTLKQGSRANLDFAKQDLSGETEYFEGLGDKKITREEAAELNRSKYKKKTQDIDLGNSKWGRRASYAIGALMATGGLVSALNSSRGQQSNAQLYGQQPLY